jgi:hypothetical protein
MVSPVRGDHRRFQAETPLIDLFKFAEPALTDPTKRQTLLKLIANEQANVRSTPQKQ